MAAGAGRRPTLTHHILRVGDLDASLAFYRGPLGMRLVAERTLNDVRTAFLVFATEGPESPEALVAHGKTLLVLRQGDPDASDGRLDPGGEDGYWKIGITLADVDLARESLLAKGIEVSAPRQFRDIGYLCHLADPDGFQIELLQHRFAENFRPLPRPEGHALGGPAGFGQITLRVRNPETSLRFYRDKLGLRLLSRQIVEPYRFTLYFLAGTDEHPPQEDLDAVENREWLWQRPYTTLELQHRWGTEDRKTTYRAHDGRRIGFEGISFISPDPAGLKARLAGFTSVQSDMRDSPFGVPATMVLDPDGNCVRFFGPKEYE